MDNSLIQEICNKACDFHSQWFRGCKEDEKKTHKFWFLAKAKQFQNVMISFCDEFMPVINQVISVCEVSNTHYQLLCASPCLDDSLKLTVAIFFDQMTRNARALDRLTTKDVSTLDIHLCVPMILSIQDRLCFISKFPAEFCFGTLVLRHSRKIDLMNLSESLLQRYMKMFPENTLVDRFISETIKARNTEIARSYVNEALTIHFPTLYEGPYKVLPCDTICDEVCNGWDTPSSDAQSSVRDEPLYIQLKKAINESLDQCGATAKPRVILSYSGGVDSTAFLLLLSHMREHFDIVALNLSYPMNREDNEQSDNEFSLVRYNCSLFSIPLYHYAVQLRRPHGDDKEDCGLSRDEFETVTKQIRFRMYRALGSSAETEPIVLLGHHCDDRDENALEQLGRGHVIGDLTGMVSFQTITGVQIFRPLIERRKEDFLHLCSKYKIKYLADSTPIWSVRGRTRRAIDSIVERKGIEGASRFFLSLTKSVELSLSCNKVMERFLPVWVSTLEKFWLADGTYWLYVLPLNEIWRMKTDDEQDNLLLLDKLIQLREKIRIVADYWNDAIPAEEQEGLTSLQKILIPSDNDLLFPVFHKALCWLLKDHDETLTLKSVRHIWSSRPDDGVDGVVGSGVTENIGFLWKGQNLITLYGKKDKLSREVKFRDLKNQIVSRLIRYNA